LVGFTLVQRPRGGPILLTLVAALACGGGVRARPAPAGARAIGPAAPALPVPARPAPLGAWPLGHGPQALPAVAPPVDGGELAQQVGALTARYAQEGVTRAGVVLQDGATGAATAVAADQVFPAASLYKLFVLWRTQVEIRAGRLDDDTELVLTPENDDAEDDGYSLGPYGSTITVDEARYLMITESNNTAAWALAYAIGWGNIEETLRANGFARSRVVGEQVTTPREVTAYFEGLVAGTLDPQLGPDDYTLMLDLLKEQTRNDYLSPGFPASAVFAHKTGDLDGVTNDAGVLLLPGGRAVYLTVLTEGDAAASVALMQDLARLAWGTLAQQAPAPAPAPPPPAGPLYFPQTGRTVSGAFARYWAANGGLALYGYPLSEEFTATLEDGQTYTVQYFERARFEWHPENPPPYDVLLGQFGRRLHPADPPAAASPGQVYFEETGHNLGGDFLAYWQANGGLAQFGYPISEEFTETLEDGQPYMVQYFERARFEHHPENDPPYDVLLGQFGRRILEGR
jgi:beta-lactamase class A